jgi:DNA-binding transcriptional MerR regulator
MNDEADNERRYSGAELTEIVRISRRTLRHWIAKKLLDPPVGTTKAAYYTPEHLHQALLIAKWKEETSLPDRSIRTRLSTEHLLRTHPVVVGDITTRLHIAIDAGFDLVFDLGRTDLKVREREQITELVLREYKRLNPAKPSRRRGD